MNDLSYTPRRMYPPRRRTEQGVSDTNGRTVSTGKHREHPATKANPAGGRR
ncbi:hypothetical protein NIB75_05690 [Bacteroides uniformis]|nr:hypothetical protein [Bacteroides uniformis]